MKESLKNCCDSNSNTRNLPILNKMLRNKEIKNISGDGDLKKNKTKKVTFSKLISSNNDVSENNYQNNLNKIFSSPAKGKNWIDSVTLNDKADQELSWLKNTPNGKTNNNNNIKIYNSQNSQTNRELFRIKKSKLKL